MRWIIDDGLRSQLPFSEVNISETLYEFEGPKIFTAHSHGLLTLWYEAAEDSDGQRYLVVPTEAAAVEKLKKGIRTVHDALSQSWLWAVDTSPAMEITAGWALGGLGTVPAECKPSRDVTLLRENEPLISYRLIGENLSEGKVPASVIIRALARPTTALKRLLEISNDAAPHGGRPPETFRKVYDLNAQRFSFNSFEVALSAPDEDEPGLLLGNESLYEAAGRRLAEAASWLDDQSLPRPSDEMLEVLKELVPPAHGQITAVEVRGRLLPSEATLQLSRSDRRLIGAQISIQNSVLQTARGRIGEFDRDNFSLILRQVDGQPIVPGHPALELRCSFPEDEHEALLAAFVSEEPVLVTGRLSANGRSFDIVGIARALAVTSTAERADPVS